MSMGICECSDPGCPVCKGKCQDKAVTTVYRIDMEDYTGTDMCDGCAGDCLESGVFRDEQDDSEDEAESGKCSECGEELYQDCMGQDRCESCDPPCPHCYDGGGPV